ncbi:hypothetical protein Pfo_000610 [Paulownia fortunei]|nr:hypothetical protein Pfo_000610 [Paulownia fortunei]
MGRGMIPELLSNLWTLVFGIVVQEPWKIEPRNGDEQQETSDNSVSTSFAYSFIRSNYVAEVLNIGCMIL